MEFVKPIRYEKVENYIFRWELKTPGRWILKRIYDLVTKKLTNTARIRLWKDRDAYINVCHINDKTPVGYTTVKALLPLATDDACIVDNTILVRYNGNMYNLTDRTPDDEIRRKMVIFWHCVQIEDKKFMFYEDIDLPIINCKCRPDLSIFTMRCGKKAYIFLCEHTGDQYTLQCDCFRCRFNL